MSKNIGKKGSLKYNFLLSAVLPLLLVGIVIAIVSFKGYKDRIYNQVKEELTNMAYAVANAYDSMYPGQYELVTEGNVYGLKKGDGYPECDYVNNIKDDTGLEISIFYNDIRMITTIVGTDGKQILGTKMNSAVRKKVEEADECRFFDKVIINGEKYFGYYMPLHDGQGNVTGVIAVAKKATVVNSTIVKTVLPILIIIVVGVGIAAVLIVIYFRKINSDFNNIETFLNEVQNGNLKASMKTSVCARDDEIGRVAEATVEMQKSLKNLIERDPLTKLYNRRFCNERLKTVVTKANNADCPFTVCIGDIDFFKKVNDTYGHDAGDMVLVAVANTLKRFMSNKGFVARWGGEEFLMVFEKNSLVESVEMLENLLNEIRAIEISYGDKIIKITMSVGAANGYGIDTEKAIKDADDRLYYAKEHGRNQVCGGIKE